MKHKKHKLDILSVDASGNVEVARDELGIQLHVDSDELMLFAQAFSYLECIEQVYAAEIFRGGAHDLDSPVSDEILDEIEARLSEFHPDFDKALCDYRAWKERLSDGR